MTTSDIDSTTETEKPHLDPELGLWLPQRFRHENGLVVRTPRVTIDLKPGASPGDPYYSMVGVKHFGEGAQNAHLSPNRVALMSYGESPEVFPLDIEFDTESNHDN